MSISATPARRIVAGLGPDGRSCVVSDTAIPQGQEGAIAVDSLWTGQALAVDNAFPVEDGFAPFRFERLAEPAYSFMHVEYGPGMGRDDPGMHYTNTADHFVVLEGEVVLVLEAGEVTYRKGDVGICRGVVHGWRNDGTVPARMVTMVLPAASVYPA